VSEEPVVVREATLRDLPDMMSVFRRGYAREPKPAMMRELIERFPCAVALNDNKISGFAYSRQATPGALELLNLLVLTEMRDCGIGTKLLSLTERTASQLGYETLVLYVSLFYGVAGSKRSPVPFYTANGFQVQAISSSEFFCWKSLSN